MLGIGWKFGKKVDVLNNVVRYTDFHSVGSKMEYKSASDYIFMLPGAVIHHLSKLKWTIILSTCEAKYVAIKKDNLSTISIGLAKISRKIYINYTIY